MSYYDKAAKPIVWIHKHTFSHLEIPRRKLPGWMRGAIVRTIPYMFRAEVVGRLWGMTQWHHKLKVIGICTRKLKAVNFVETGCAAGEVLAKCVPHFKKLYSIELDEKSHKTVQKRFANEKKVTILQGDSGKKIAEITPKLKGPTLFWLDAHGTREETDAGLYIPIREELKHVLPLKIKKIILIDDARYFQGRHAQIKMKELKSIVRKHDPSLKFKVRGDIIRIY